MTGREGVATRKPTNQIRFFPSFEYPLTRTSTHYSARFLPKFPGRVPDPLKLKTITLFFVEGQWVNGTGQSGRVFMFAPTRHLITANFFHFFIHPPRP